MSDLHGRPGGSDPTAADDHTTWAESLTDDVLADELDGIGAGALTPAERAAVLVEAASRLRRINDERHQAAIVAAIDEDEVEPTACYWVE
jgi:DICT domain-containing protein